MNVYHSNTYDDLIGALREIEYALNTAEAHLNDLKTYAEDVQGVADDEEPPAAVQNLQTTIESLDSTLYNALSEREDIESALQDCAPDPEEEPTQLRLVADEEATK